MRDLIFVKLWTIYLARWVLEDGNYGTLSVGQQAEFALEVLSTHQLRSTHATDLVARHLGLARYNIVGKLDCLTVDVWSLDCGIGAYSEDEDPPPQSIGDFVSGNVTLGIDPFMYAEYLSLRSELPPLVYTWLIHGINEIQAGDESANREYIPVNRASAEGSNQFASDFLLECELLPVPPKRTSAMFVREDA